jgi:cell shape-determining protein MreC
MEKTLTEFIIIIIIIIIISSSSSSSSSSIRVAVHKMHKCYNNLFRDVSKIIDKFVDGDKRQYSDSSERHRGSI